MPTSTPTGHEGQGSLQHVGGRKATDNKFLGILRGKTMLSIYLGIDLLALRLAVRSRPRFWQ